jgi:Family of unknown function (DUF5329)
MGVRTIVAVASTWCALALAGPAGGAELTPAAKREIAQLLERIAASNCSFYRNGSWYAARDASKHLQEKLDYMVRRDMLGSTEDFIDQAASASSISGKPYQIRCGEQAAVPSADWLHAELRRMRSPY